MLNESPRRDRKAHCLLLVTDKWALTSDRIEGLLDVILVVGLVLRDAD